MNKYAVSKNGMLLVNGGRIRCPFVDGQQCGAWCHHCSVKKDFSISDKVPSKLFGIIPYHTTGWVEDGHKVEITCGGETIVYYDVEVQDA